MKNATILSIFAALAAAIGIFYFYSKADVARAADYEKCLTEEYLKKEEEKLGAQARFWEQKLENSPGNFVFQKKLAGLYAADFKLSGDIRQLHRSDSLLESVNARIPNQVGVLQSLAANAITRHAFREAEHYIREAHKIGDEKFSSTLMLADVLLERGQRLEAELLLEDIASRSHFDYLVRASKLQDQSDALDDAVQSMEEALVLAETSGSAKLINWSLSNLGDMYGHQGKVGKSYRTYLEALRRNPADLHSLKGIAWIAFSYDKNTAEAKRILAFLKSVHLLPDYDLFLAEIAAYEGNLKKKQQYEEFFLAEASKGSYGNMYKSYTATIAGKSEALKIARAEVAERPHPMSYNLLAWAAFQKGEQAKAVDILEKHVLGQTGEPVALYRSGIILKGSGKKQKARQQLDAALEASFELGPVVTAEIEKELDEL